ncbi:MAG: acyl-CoA dehydrogenase family protein [Planctomycetes bacterium]|nr:acyl-CoA dehydrogenase family protein [Planctomycetota bacterium]
MNELGLFGIKIPTKYGGLGQSQTIPARALGHRRLLRVHPRPPSAHQSIGLPQPLKLFGTEAQKQKYLTRIARGEVTAFALTEPGVGSNRRTSRCDQPSSPDGKHWILNGESCWGARTASSPT